MPCRNLAALLFTVAVGSAAAPSFAQVQLTEFLARNESVLPDEDGEYSDWIELFNTGAEPVSLLGWALTDDEGEPDKWVFPAEELGAGEYLIVFASDKDRTLAGAPLHTNFKLSGGGEYLALIRPGGVVATAYSPEYPEQSDDVSYGLQADLLTRVFFDPPTPGAENTAGAEMLAPVQFSIPHGVILESQDVALSHPSAGATIHFTRNGAEPTPLDPIYTTPLRLSQTATIRARAFQPGFLPSPVAASSWLHPRQAITQNLGFAESRGLPNEWIDRFGTNWDLGGTRPGAWYGMDNAVLAPYATPLLIDALKAIPSVSLLMHPDDLFGFAAPSGKLGMYPNSTEEGDDFERACSLEWIDPSGELDFTVTCGTNIQGGSSTNPNQRAQLSLALKFQSQYGPSKLEYQVFDHSPVDEFDYLVLDAGNQLAINDLAGSAAKIHAQEVRDGFMADLHRRMGHPSPRGRWVHLYLNGLYWGVYYLHERPDTRFAAAYGPGDNEEYDWIKRGTVSDGNNGNVGTPTPGRWKEVRSIIDGGVAPGSMWMGQDAFSALDERVDLANYIDYMLSNWYGGNTDWPQNNWMATAHARLSADFADVNPGGKFRFHAWDAETTLFWGGAAEAVNDGFWDRTASGSDVFNNAAYIHRAALSHPDYQILLADRVQQHLLTPGGAFWVEPGFDQPGTPFDTSRPDRNVPASLYERLAAELAPAVVMEYARWGNYFDEPGQYTPDTWDIERRRIMEDYFPVRSRVFLDQLEAATPRLYPEVAPPAFSLPSGSYALGVDLTVSQDQGLEVYYTLDGSDPRLSLGSISPTALIAASELDLPRGVHRVVARAFDGTQWAAKITRTYIIGYGITINELQASNDTTIADPSGEYDDWIELRNLTSEPLNLSGFFLTDDPSEPQQYEIPSGVVIEPFGRLLFWADDDGDQGSLHANFKLSAGGEYVGLFAPLALSGEVIDQVTFPALDDDAAYARIPDGRGPFMVVEQPTPFAVNGPADGGGGQLAR